MNVLITLFAVIAMPFLLHWTHGKKIVSWPLLIIYSISVLFITLGSRSGDSETFVCLNPLYIYFLVAEAIAGWKPRFGLHDLGRRIIYWYKEPILSIGLNIMLFIPLGYLTPACSSKINRWWKALLLGFGVSALIEIVQLITRLGWFDTSDLLHNTLGTLIGFGIYLNWLKLNIPNTNELKT